MKRWISQTIMYISWISVLSCITLTFVETFIPDYIFIHGDSPGLNRNALWEVRALYIIPVIYWAVEDPLYHQKLSRGVAQNSDYVLTPCVELLTEFVYDNHSCYHRAQTLVNFLERNR